MHPSIIRPNYQIQPPPAATLQPILTESLTTPPPAKPRSDIPPGLSIEVNVTKGLNLEVNVTTELNPEVNATTPDDTGFSLCLDIASTYVNESDILLLNDTENDLVVTGILQTEKFGDHRKFESVSVRLNGNDVLRVAVTSVRISNITYRWWQMSSLSTDDVTITGGDTIELMTPSNASLVFHKYGIQTRRSLSSPFITVSVNNIQHLSPDSTGVIGSLLRLEKLELMADNKLQFEKDGILQNVVTSPDKRSDGSTCHRITESIELAKALNV